MKVILLKCFLLLHKGLFNSERERENKKMSLIKQLTFGFIFKLQAIQHRIIFFSVRHIPLRVFDKEHQDKRYAGVTLKADNGAF